MDKIRPKVGIGVYITDGKGNLLMMRRTGALATGTWCPPGGHLEMGETFLECCKKEVREEVGLDIEDVEMLGGAVNNIFSGDTHYVNVNFIAKGAAGEPTIGEPEKISSVGWYPVDDLPQPLMLPVANLLKTYPEVREKLKTFDSFSNPKRKYLSFNAVMQIGLVAFTMLGFLLTSLKLPQYGLAANLVSEIFWLYSSYKAWKNANQVGIFINTIFITIILMFGVVNYWLL